MKKLVGTWEEVSHVANGNAKPAAEVKGHTVVIDSAGKWEAFKDGTSLLTGTVKLDPARKPRAADWAIDGSDMVAKGIYEVDGDTWKHCFALSSCAYFRVAMARHGVQCLYVGVGTDRGGLRVDALPARQARR